MPEINFFWDPLEDNIVQERDESGAVVADYTTEPYLYGDLVSQRRGGQSSFYCYDGLGSTLALTNASGVVTDTNAYTAFGEVTEHSGSTVNPFRYIGQNEYFEDASLGTFNARRRVLSPIHSRWLSLDPVRLFGTGETFTLYTYVSNNPTNAIDPSGLVALIFTDPHTGQRKTLAASICRTGAELAQEHLGRQQQRPLTSCVFEVCSASVGQAWNSPRVQACKSALDEYKNNTSGGFRCGDILDVPPSCDPTCQYLALYFPSTHSITVCADAVARNLSDPGRLESQLEEVLCHELLHARQSLVCRPTNNPYATGDRCQNSLRKELQAYCCTTRCEWFWDCLERALRSSCPASCDPGGMPPQPTQQQIDTLYEWANRFYQQGRFCPTGYPRRA